MSGTSRPSQDAIEFSGNFDSVWTGDTVTVWKIKPVVFGFAGKLSEPFNPSIDSIARWALEDSLRIGIHNRTQQVRKYNLSFAVSQNICSSARSFTVGEKSYSFTNNQTAIRVSIDLTLAPKEDIKKMMNINSDRCIDKATGMELSVAISEIISTSR